MKMRSLPVLAVMLALAACVAIVIPVTTAGCSAWAQEVSLTGQVQWRVLLGTGPEEELSPGGEFGGGPAIGGATWGGRLTGLDAATGVVRWTLPVSGIGPQTAAVATADGGLAVAGMLGQLLMVDMADGTVRWNRAITDPTGLAAAAGQVLYGSGDRLTAYDDRTGVPQWTVASTDMDLPQMQLAAGLLLVSSAFGGTPVTAYIPATGRVAWTFETPGPQAGATGTSAAVAAGTAGVAVAVANLPGPGRLYLLDPATGRVRWQVTTLVGAGPLLTAAGVTDIEGTAANGPAVIVDRDAADGRIRWQDKLPANVADSPDFVPGQGILVQPNLPFSGCGPVPA